MTKNTINPMTSSMAMMIRAQCHVFKVVVLFAGDDFFVGGDDPFYFGDGGAFNNSMTFLYFFFSAFSKSNKSFLL